MEPVPPSARVRGTRTAFIASVVCTDPAGLLFIFTTVRCLSAWSLYPLPRTLSVTAHGTLIQCHNRSLLECVGPVSPSTGVVCTDTAKRAFSRCLRAIGMYPLPPVLSVPTPRDAHPVSQPSAAWVRGACIPFRARRVYRPAGRSFSVHNLSPLEYMAIVPHSAGVVCADAAGRSFRRCWSAWGLYPLPRASSAPIPRDAHPFSESVFATVYRSKLRCLCCRPSLEHGLHNGRPVVWFDSSTPYSTNPRCAQMPSPVVCSPRPRWPGANTLPARRSRRPNTAHRSETTCPASRGPVHYRTGYAAPKPPFL